MTENTSTFEAPPDPDPRPRGTALMSDLRTLRRSRDDRVLAGVCGGLARRFDLDPLLLRILTGVLAVFGGVGILLYALAWLLIPEEGRDESVLEETLGRQTPPRQRTAGRIALTVALVVVSIVAVGVVFNGPVDRTLLLILAVAGLYLLLRRDGSASSGIAPAQATPPPGEPTRPVPTPVPPPPPPPRPRSVLFPLVVSAALVSVGALAMADFWDAEVPAAAYVALPLAVVGAGLILGAWFGRSPGLVVLGVLLGAALLPTAAADQWADEDHDLRVTPRTVDDVRGTHDHGAGRIVYDLREVDFPSGSTDMRIDIGAGELVVIVPRELDVALDVSLGIGEVKAFGDSHGGFGVDRRVVDEGPDGAGGGRLVLDIEQGVGSAEVRRAAA